MKNSGGEFDEGEGPDIKGRKGLILIRRIVVVARRR